MPRGKRIDSGLTQMRKHTKTFIQNNGRARLAKEKRTFSRWGKQTLISLFSFKPDFLSLHVTDPGLYPLGVRSATPSSKDVSSHCHLSPAWYWWDWKPLIYPMRYLSRTAIRRKGTKTSVIQCVDSRLEREEQHKREQAVFHTEFPFSHGNPSLKGLLWKLKRKFKYIQI